MYFLVATLVAIKSFTNNLMIKMYLFMLISECSFKLSAAKKAEKPAKKAKKPVAKKEKPVAKKPVAKKPVASSQKGEASSQKGEEQFCFSLNCFFV